HERLALQRARACLSLNVARNLSAWAEWAGGNSAAVTTSCEGITVSSGIYHAPLTASSRPQQNSYDTRRHQIGHRAGDHGAESQFGQIVPPVGCKRAESADLDADGAEVGKAAQCKGRDSDGPRIQRRLLRAEQGKCHQFVQHHAGPKQIADGKAVVPGHPDEPG